VPHSNLPFSDIFTKPAYKILGPNTLAYFAVAAVTNKQKGFYNIANVIKLFCP
jgi:hypothetical protein